MTPSLSDLENMMLDQLRQGRLKNELSQLKVLEAVQNVAPQNDQLNFLAVLYATDPHTLNQFDEGGMVSELLYHNVRRHLIEFGKKYIESSNAHEEKYGVVHPREWR